MRSRSMGYWGTLGFCVLLAAPHSAGQQKPLVNADVVQMVKGGLPESTIIRAVGSAASAFDVSPEALIILHSAGVNEKLMDAMIAAASSTRPRDTRATPRGRRSSGSLRTATSPSRRQPSVVCVDAGTSIPMPLERTTLAQTQAKPSSLTALATDKMLDEAKRTGITAARQAGGQLGRTAGEAAKGIAGMIGGSKSTKAMTYVWVLEKGTQPTALETASPAFDVALNETVGVRAAEYSPVIVKLTPTPRGTLLVGATSGKTGATADRTLEWPLYSSFVEDRTAAQVRATAEGQWNVTVPAPLPPGDYAVVLRPTVKDKKYSGVDVARNQGDGLAFNSVWPFSIR